MSPALPNDLAGQLLRGLHGAIEDVGQERGLPPLEIAQQLHVHDMPDKATSTMLFEDDGPRIHFAIAPSQHNMAMSVNTQHLRDLLDEADVRVVNFIGLEQVAAVRVSGAYGGVRVTVDYFLEPRDLDQDI